MKWRTLTVVALFATLVSFSQHVNAEEVVQESVLSEEHLTWLTVERSCTLPDSRELTLKLFREQISEEDARMNSKYVIEMLLDDEKISMAMFSIANGEAWEQIIVYANNLDGTWTYFVLKGPQDQEELNTHEYGKKWFGTSYEFVKNDNACLRAERLIKSAIIRMR